jgi:hypothetical protein
MQMTPTTKGKGLLKAKGARAEPSKVKPAARKDFGHLTHEATREEPKPLVATMTGYHGLKFVLPLGLDPQGPPNVERNFDQHYRQYHDCLHRAGTIQGWLQLAELCRGKSRLVAALWLAFTGPVCGAFGWLRGCNSSSNATLRSLRRRLGASLQQSGVESSHSSTSRRGRRETIPVSSVVGSAGPA